jgi:adenosine kinase
LLIVTGTIGFDHILNFDGRFGDHILPDKIHKINISFTTRGIKKEFGGTAGNQTYSLALLGERPFLFTTVGSDFGEYEKHLQRVGVNTDYVEKVNKPCAVGFVMTDRDDNQIWAYGSGSAWDIGRFSLKHFLKKTQRAPLSQLFIVLAPQNENAMIAWTRECKKLGIRYSFDPAFYIPGMKEKEIEGAIAGAELVFGNDYEIALLSSKLKVQMSKLQLKLKNLKVIITTFGPKGSMVSYRNNERKIEKIRIKAAKPKKVVDPTGAGDAYRAGFIVGYLRGKDLETCGCMGSVAASFAIERYGTIKHSFTIGEFEERYREAYSEKLKL